MFSRCGNPDCQATFDYREGQLFRFHKDHPADQPPPNVHSVQHFWLCARCARKYTLEYREGMGVILRPPFEEPVAEWSRLIAAA